MADIPQQRGELIKMLLYNNALDDDIIIELFHFQHTHNPVYRAYADMVLKGKKVKSVSEIPFLPISFFKTHQVCNSYVTPEFYFASSGTTGMQRSRHFVHDVNLYQQIFIGIFTQTYGSPAKYCILGLLPSYLEQGQSSLVYMVDHLMHLSANPLSKMYLDDFNTLSSVLKANAARGIKTVLFGVTYALLNFAEQTDLKLQDCIVIETGGMKGRKKEITRQEVHQVLKEQFSLSEIHSEYGMTEMLSQAYSTGDGFFRSNKYFTACMRQPDDPFDVAIAPHEGTGMLNVIDIGNIDSCCFIATDDRVKFSEANLFELPGRADHTDVRGCSQLAL